MHRLHIKDLTVLCSAAALLFCLSSCSSGELAPFSKNYESAEELTDMLIANYDGSEAQLKALKKNTAIHHFFTPEEADNQIARTLYSAKETLRLLTGRANRLQWKVSATAAWTFTISMLCAALIPSGTAPWPSATAPRL